MSLSTCGRVENFALYSRILVISLQMLFNYLIPDHDAGVFNPPVQHEPKILDFALEPFLSGLRRWDGVYFIHIAEHGYTYENTLAFFPLFPACVRILANTVFFPLQYVVSYMNVLTLSAFVINFVLFVRCAKVLYELSVCVLKNKVLAFKAALLFCINPASIFFTAAYSETMFAFLTFKGLLCLHLKQNNSAMFWFGLSCLTRSNGLINVGFMLYAGVREIVCLLILPVKAKSSLNRDATVLKQIFKVVATMLKQVFCCLCFFMLYQYYAYVLYCNGSATAKDISPHLVEYGNQKGYKMFHTGPSKWCHYSIPLSYSYVQQNHWDVGFLKYYEFRQIPNFILALPMVLICIGAVLYYIRKNLAYCMALGLYEQISYLYKKTDDNTRTTVTGYLGPDIYVYVVHLTFLVSFAVLMMHVQVTTRFIACSSPLIYWYIATVTTPDNKLDQGNLIENSKDYSGGDYPENETAGFKAKPETMKTKHSDSTNDSAALMDFDNLYDWDNSSIFHKSVFIYFHLFFFVGTAAFPNFLPWT